VVRTTDQMHKSDSRLHGYACKEQGAEQAISGGLRGLVLIVRRLKGLKQGCSLGRARSR